MDLLNHLARTENTFTTTLLFEVINIYTIIPHNYGLKTSKFLLDTPQTYIPNRIGKSFEFEAQQFIL